jgi:signal transduction histidine kinase
VLVNLIGNAIKYAPRKPIEIEVSADELEARISVTDQGVGIPADQQALIFERFGRAPTKMKVSGLGLGLYVSKEIVLAHGGTIEVKSAEGHGSAFIVRLPRALAAIQGLSRVKKPLIVPEEGAS